MATGLTSALLAAMLVCGNQPAVRAAEVEVLYKGIRLGASDKEFVQHNRDFRCEVAAATSRLKVCKALQTIYANQSTDSVTAQFIDGRLERVSINYPVVKGAAKAIAWLVAFDEALMGEYGPLNYGRDVWKDISNTERPLSVRNYVWRGRNGTIAALTYWYLREDEYQTTVTLVADGSYEREAQIRNPPNDKTM